MKKLVFPTANAAWEYQRTNPEWAHSRLTSVVNGWEIERTMTLTYTVWSLDVWGNEEDGFEVNDRCEVGTIELDDSLDAEGVLAALDEAGYVHASLCAVDEAISFDGAIYIDSALNGRPLLQLERQVS